MLRVPCCMQVHPIHWVCIRVWFCDWKDWAAGQSVAMCDTSLLHILHNTTHMCNYAEPHSPTLCGWRQCKSSLSNYTLKVPEVWSPTSSVQEIRVYNDRLSTIWPYHMFLVHVLWMRKMGCRYCGSAYNNMNGRLAFETQLFMPDPLFRLIVLSSLGLAMSCVD